MATTENRAPRNTTGAIAKAAAGKTAANSERATMQRLINRMSPEVAKALPKHISVERFTRMALSAVSATPALAKCTPESFLGAYLQAAQLGVEPNTPLGQAYLIPYTNNRERRTECTFQLGYKGLLDLAYRSGQVVSVQSQTVYENDEFEYQLGLHPDLKHVPARHDRGEAIAYYAVVNLKDGGYIFEVMSADDVRAHAKKFSQAYSNGPWQSNFDSMAKKTVLKKCLNLAPLSADTMRTIAADESIKTDLGVDMTEVAGTYVVDDDTGEVVAEVNPENTENEQEVPTNE